MESMEDALFNNMASRTDAETEKGYELRRQELDQWIAREKVILSERKNISPDELAKNVVSFEEESKGILEKYKQELERINNLSSDRLKSRALGSLELDYSTMMYALKAKYSIST